jgi:outer membrane protein TolC
MKYALRLGTLYPAVLALAFFWARPLAAQAPLTLEQAVRQVLERNPELAIDSPARAAAVSGLAAGKAGYLPRIDLEQSILGGNNPVYAFGTLLTQRQFTAADFALSALNTPDALQNLQTRIQVQQNVWDFGRTRQNIESAKLGVEMADLGHATHIKQTLLAAIEAYYSVSLAGEALDAARAALVSADALVKQSQSRTQAGLAVESDVLRSQVYLAAARQQEIQALGNGEVARAALNRLMGNALDSPIGNTAALAVVNAPIPPEEILAAGLRKQRPDYQALQAEVRQAELDVRGKKLQLLPTLGAFATWEADNPSLIEAGGSNWIAGLTLRWNVFAGGGDSAQLQAARLRLQQKQLQLKAMESAMEMEVYKAVVQVRSATEQVAAMQAAEAQSQESLRILKNRYEAGLATITDLLSAETARSAARTALAEAIYQQRLNYARMEYASGLLAPDSASMK